MSRKFNSAFCGFAVLGAILVGMTLLASFASAQAPTLQEQLAAQYKLVKMGSDTSGFSVVEKGTLLAIQKGGILGVPYSDKSVLNTKFEGGAVHSPNNALVEGKKRLLGQRAAGSAIADDDRRIDGSGGVDVGHADGPHEVHRQL